MRGDTLSLCRDSKSRQLEAPGLLLPGVCSANHHPECSEVSELTLEGFGDSVDSSSALYSNSRNSQS